MTAQLPRFAVVVPMKNEEDNIDLLIGEIETACQGENFEAIFVDDGSTDATLARLRQASSLKLWVRVLHHPTSGGQSAAVHSGVMAARAPIICTMDGDGQNPPSEIPRLVAPFSRQVSIATLAWSPGNAPDGRTRCRRRLPHVWPMASARASCRTRPATRAAG